MDCKIYSQLQCIRLVRLPGKNFFFIRVNTADDVWIAQQSLLSHQMGHVQFIGDHDWHGMYPDKEVQRPANEISWTVVSPKAKQRYQTRLRHQSGKKITEKKQKWGDDVDRRAQEKCAIDRE